VQFWRSVMEVLLELNESRKILTVDRDELVYTVKHEIELLGIRGVLAYFSCPRGQSSSSKKVFILQRWSEKWKSFVDVTDIEQVEEGDRLILQCDTNMVATEQNCGTSSSFDVSRGKVCEL